MLRRLLLTFLLIVSFGFAQIGAVTHEISHYAEANAQTQPQDYNQNSELGADKNTNQNNPASHGHTCAKCLSYAELGGVISSNHIALCLENSLTHLTSSQLQSFSANKPHTYSARAPPSFA